MLSNQPAIRTQGLAKLYGRKQALAGLDFVIPRGQVTALIGHNGAGKTTLIRLLLGMLEPTRGCSFLLGQNSLSLSAETRSRIGYLAEGHYLWRWMRAKDAAKLQRETFPKWDQTLFDAMLEFFGVSPDAKVRSVSRGQRAGISLAMTLATDPELLVLDDPSMGLDPVARRALVEGLLAFARREGRTILVCTHLLDDVERLADRIAIMSSGRLVVNAAIDVFQNRLSGWQIDGRLLCSPSIPGLVDARSAATSTQLVVADADEETHAAIGRLGSGASAEQLSFEDAVLAYLRPSTTIGSISSLFGA
jgi:ABC-2 type transport system ATP-binding protein